MSYHKEIARKIGEFNREPALKRAEKLKELMLGFSATALTKNRKKLDKELGDAVDAKK